jgi:hypothetical protein
LFDKLNLKLFAVFQNDQILEIEYLTDMCVQFSEPADLLENSVKVSVKTAFFNFRPHTKHVTGIKAVDQKMNLMEFTATEAVFLKKSYAPEIAKPNFRWIV